MISRFVPHSASSSSARNGIAKNLNARPPAFAVFGDKGIRMQVLRRFRCEGLSLLAALLICALPCLAQKGQPDRIAGPIDTNQMVTLTGHVHPMAQAQYDKGPVDASQEMGYVTLLIKPTASQQAAVQQLLAEQHDQSSKNYHKWLTPEQYADRFGLSQNDIRSMQTWLQSQGFTVVQTARGRNWIAFSGTAAQVESTFHTAIHSYNVNGEKHMANVSAPQIPSALAGIVTGLRGLTDFHPRALGVHMVAPNKMFPAPIIRPDYTLSGSHFLAPDDVATIYNIAPLYTAGFNGTGQKVVIVGQTDITTSDITEFRAGFGLPPSSPTVVLVGADPGHTPDEVEADLDLEWVGAVARGATVIYVNSTDVFTSAYDAIDNNRAPVISMSYGLCEAQDAFFIISDEAELAKANTFGITFMASSGDSGSASCDLDTQASANMGLAVNFPASSVSVTGVGGTTFSEGSGTFWNGTNGSTGSSAISYIPEIGWNDTAFNGSLSASGGGKSSCGLVNGASACTGGFPKPSWQVATGVPTDGVRDVPDVSIAASADHDGYIFCTRITTSTGTCDAGIATAISLHNSIVGGTSASSPVFAGMVTILNQFAVTNGVLTTPGFGNLNTQLYPLAQSTPTAFHDVTTGNNIVPCQTGTTGCPSSAPFQYGYSAATGFDLVTGLGSVDANVLASAFAAPVSTTTTLSFLPNPVNAGTSVTFTATVAPTSGTAKPTGTVTFFNGSSQLGTGSLSNGTATLSTHPFATAGNYSVTASYGGGGNFLASGSSAVSVPVVDFTLAASLNALSITRGQSGMVMLSVTSLNGFSTALTYSCSGLPANSTCTASNVTTGGATVTITTTLPSARLAGALFGNSKGPFYALFLPGCLGVCLAVSKSSRKLTGTRTLMLVSLLAFSVLWMVACGGGSSGGGGGGGNSGTPVGTYTVIVMGTTGGTNALTHAATPSITLTVN